MKRDDSHLPNLFVIGAPKAGTTSLVSQLGQHPEIFVPEIKEPHLLFEGFDTSWYYYKQKMVLGTKKVKRLYVEGCKRKYRVDGSVHYLGFSDFIAEKMKETSPNAKVIAIVRNPRDRILSHFLMDQRTGLVKKDLNEALHCDDLNGSEYLRCSEYLRHVKKFKTVFGDDFMLFDFDDYVNKNSAVISFLAQNLNISSFDFEPVNENGYRRPIWPVSLLYGNYYVRNLYNWLINDRVKERLRRLYLSKEKPKISIPNDSTTLNALYQEYLEVKKMCNRLPPSSY